jgi:hypothetical protein
LCSKKPRESQGIGEEEAKGGKTSPNVQEEIREVEAQKQRETHGRRREREDE